jgi:dCTP deaminase
MILSNRQLYAALDEKRLIINPEPAPRLPEVTGGYCPYGTHSVDLRLSDEIVIPQDEGLINIDFARQGNIAEHLDKHSRHLKISEDRPYVFEHGKFVLGMTLERVELPIDPRSETCLAARIEGKSSRARFGLLVHFTAPTVHPGFQGNLTLEMINLGPWPLVLKPGLPIAQLIVEEVRGCPIENPSQFQSQATAAGSAKRRRRRGP